ncbi:MAG: PA2779 family protein [Gallionella sp.]|nr:PA2779 family protein [Gallionella sp.]
MNSQFMRITSRFMIASVLSLGLPIQSAYAGIVGTDKVAAAAHTQSERARIGSYLEREDVSKALQAEGIDADAAKARVAAMTDEEVLKVAGKLDQVPAGGDVVGVLLTVFIILLVTDILGFTSVFPFTHSAR